jgi:hypothetical protein
MFLNDSMELIMIYLLVLYKHFLYIEKELFNYLICREVSMFSCLHLSNMHCIYHVIDLSTFSNKIYNKQQQHMDLKYILWICICFPYGSSLYTKYICTYINWFLRNNIGFVMVDVLLEYIIFH